MNYPHQSPSRLPSDRATDLFERDGFTSSPMCGGAIFERFRRSPAKESPSRSCLAAPHALNFRRNGTYTEVDEDLKSPDTEGSSSMDGGSSKDDFECTDELPSYIVQFNPQGAQQSKGPMVSILKSTSIWSNPLPAVTEVDSLDESSTASSVKSAKNPAFGNGEALNLNRFSVQEKDEMLTSMRQLILKQQTSIVELAEQNKVMRRDISERHQTIIRILTESKKREGAFNEMKKAKELLAAENKRLSKELEMIKEKRPLTSDMRVCNDFKTSINKKSYSNSFENESAGVISHQSRLTRKASEVRQNRPSSKRIPKKTEPDVVSPKEVQFEETKDSPFSDENVVSIFRAQRSDTRNIEEANLFSKEREEMFTEIFEDNSKDDFRDDRCEETDENQVDTTQDFDNVKFEYNEAERARQEIEIFKQRLQNVQLRRAQRKPNEERRNPIVRFREYE